MAEAELQPQRFRMPAEWEPHAAVWLQWPAENMRHQPGYHVKLESTWLAMTRAMQPHVEVRIVEGRVRIELGDDRDGLPRYLPLAPAAQKPRAVG